MSGRGIDSPTAAALAAPHVITCLLAELYLDGGTQYLTSAPHDVDWGGHTYSTLGGLASVEAIKETATEAQGLTFTLAAVNEAAIAGAFEHVQGRKVILRLAVVDTSTTPPTLRVDANVWTGYLDVLTIEDQASQPVIRCTAEHAMLAWRTPTGQLYSHAEQQAIDPADLFFEYAADLADATIVWPSREFFKQ